MPWLIDALKAAHGCLGEGYGVRGIALEILRACALEEFHPAEIGGAYANRNAARNKALGPEPFQSLPCKGGNCLAQVGKVRHLVAKGARGCKGPSLSASAHVDHGNTAQLKDGVEDVDAVEPLHAKGVCCAQLGYCLYALCGKPFGKAPSHTPDLFHPYAREKIGHAFLIRCKGKGAASPPLCNMACKLCEGTGAGKAYGHRDTSVVQDAINKVGTEVVAAGLKDAIEIQKGLVYAVLFDPGAEVGQYLHDPARDFGVEAEVGGKDLHVVGLEQAFQLKGRHAHLDAQGLGLCRAGNDAAVVAREHDQGSALQIRAKECFAGGEEVVAVDYGPEAPCRGRRKPFFHGPNSCGWALLL